ELHGTAGHATIRMIARDFDDDLLEQHVQLIRATAERVVADEPRAKLTVEARPQYPNMRRHIEEFPQVIEVAERAIRAEGIEPVRTPIRGGTDGSLLSARGLSTPAALKSARRASSRRGRQATSPRAAGIVAPSKSEPSATCSAPIRSATWRAWATIVDSGVSRSSLPSARVKPTANTIPTSPP